jgi:GT2 family glycosyltransferase
MLNVIIDNQTYNIPDDFHWQSYIARHPDLVNAGIDTESKAIYHYIFHGKKENRLYHKIQAKEMNSLLPTPKQENQPSIVYSAKHPFHTAISVLFFYPEERSLNFLKHAPKLFIDELLKINHNNKITFVIRNNSLNYNSQNILKYIDELQHKYHKYPEVKIQYFSTHNKGFGQGHNDNLLSVDDIDFVLCLNDDLGFPNCHWLREAFYLFENHKDIGVIGSKQSPQFIQNKFAFGNDRNLLLRKAPDYAEGSILLSRGSLYRKLNGFDPTFEYFYFEDVDFCFRAKQLGYTIANIDIPHQHFRSDSTKKIPSTVKSSIIEHNRAKFLCKWSKHINNNRELMTNNILISLKADGFGDLVDCVLPVRELVKKHSLNNIEFYIPGDKVDSLFKLFNKPILHDYPDIDNYDIVYDIDNLNLSTPFNTIDIISSKLGITTFVTEADDIKKFILENIETSLLIPKKDYISLHLDSQRNGFEGRMPHQDQFLPLLSYLATKNQPIVLLGQSLDKDSPQYGEKFEEKISEMIKQKKLLDHRQPANVSDIIRIVAGSSLFIGLDSGPSHVAQLLDIPSFIIYGPINPLSKMYRYDKHGCWFNMSNDSLSGSYHKNLYPSYHYDLRRDAECINIDGKQLQQQIQHFIDNKFKFDWMPVYQKFRYNQRDFLNLQFHNPLYRNRILDGSLTSPEDIDLFVRVLNLYEEHTINLMRKQL